MILSDSDDESMYHARRVTCSGSTIATTHSVFVGMVSITVERRSGRPVMAWFKSIERRGEIFPANTVIDSYVTPLPPSSKARQKQKARLDE